MSQVQLKVLIFMLLVVDVLFRVPRVSGSSLFSIYLEACFYLRLPKVSDSLASVLLITHRIRKKNKARKLVLGHALLLASSTCAGVTARSLSQSAVATYPS